MCQYQRHHKEIDPSELDFLPSTLRDKILQMHFRAIHQDKYTWVCLGIEARKKLGAFMRENQYVYAQAFNFMRMYRGLGGLAYST